MINIQKAIEIMEDQAVLVHEIYRKVFPEESDAFELAVTALKEKRHNDELRKNARLVELPCAVNDTVYTLVSTESGYIIKKMQVKEIQLKHRPFGDSVFMLEEIGRRGCLFKYYETDFGKAVFSTHEEAEAALMEREVQE